MHELCTMDAGSALLQALPKSLQLMLLAFAKGFVLSENFASLCF